jgi:hypothetical protein
MAGHCGGALPTHRNEAGVPSALSLMCRPPPSTRAPKGPIFGRRKAHGYGISCFGCCGVLMGLLLVGGVMNVFWMAAIATGALAEKVLPWGGGLAVLPAPGSSAGEHFARGRGYLSKRPRGHHSRACRSRKVGFAPLSVAREPSKASGQFQARGPERSRPKVGTIPSAGPGTVPVQGRDKSPEFVASPLQVIFIGIAPRKSCLPISTPT